MIGWISRLLLQLVVKTQTSRAAAWFGSEDTEPMLLGEATDASPPGSGSLSSRRYLLYVPLTGQQWHKASLGPLSRHARRLQKYLWPRRHSPQRGRLWRKAINLAPPRGLEPGGWLPEVRGCRSRCTSTDCHRNKDTSDQTRVLTNTADRSVPGYRVIFDCCLLCLYRVSRCYSASEGKYFCTQEVPLLNISNDDILHYTLKRNF